jgi:MoxR-like ATPase
MKKRYTIIYPVYRAGAIIGTDVTGYNDITYMTRDVMLKDAYNNGQAVLHDAESNRCRRIDMNDVHHYDSAVMEMDTAYPVEEPVAPVIENADPIFQLIQSAPSLKPDTLVISDIKWKYLVRNIARGKNIMMTGPSGSGKSISAKSAADALSREFFYFNLGATQDPRSTLIGNTHFNKDDGTVFAPSLFVKAIQTPNAVILLDELSRAHPEAWNILMTVLDSHQKYLRLDEDKNATTIHVADGVSFIATANIGSEYTATRAMDRALLDRFTILEMEALDEEQEYGLLIKEFPTVPIGQLKLLAAIAANTRKECRSEAPKISSAISTRLTKEVGSLLEDGFTLSEAAETCIYPFYDSEGGIDSERTYIKQVLQKYIGEPVDNANNPF